ncbi:MAG: TetR family transcriptional regulator [Actinomycetota bacterium]|nr:TetR family transcriptional regulator [Actinomycetota bacterium]
MATQVETLLTEKQSARRRRVIKAAMVLAAEGGYDAVQMRDVAARARVALGTLYRYFPSKDQLLVAALGEWTGELQQRLVTRPPRGSTPVERVTDVLRRATRALEREPQLTAALVTALSSLTSEDPKALEDASSVYLVMSEIIGHAMDDGDVHDREATVRVLGQVWFSALVAWVRGWGPDGQMFKDLEAAVRLLLPH